MKKAFGILFVTLFLRCSSTVWAAAGTAGASFLDIPVGAAPAALGGAYSALATDAYSPIYNPAGVGFLDHTELAGQHLSYVDSIHHEYLGFVHPLYRGFGLGASAQYLNSGSITRTDVDGTSHGDFSTSFGAYTLTVGHQIGQDWAVGMSGKMIDASIADFHARAFAADFGALYRINSHSTAAGVVSNLGTKLKFDQEEDNLPQTLRLGAAYRFTPFLMGTLEGDFQRQDGPSLHTGVQWNPMPYLFLRAGYRTDTLKELSALAGLSAGMGLNIIGQEISYAWLPLGDLGNTHYLSFVLRWGQAESAKRNLVYLPHHQAQKDDQSFDPVDPQLMELLKYADSPREAQAPK